MAFFGIEGDEWDTGRVFFLTIVRLYASEATRRARLGFEEQSLSSDVGRRGSCPFISIALAAARDYSLVRERRRPCARAHRVASLLH